jgi:cellulose synthase operon protein C
VLALARLANDEAIAALIEALGSAGEDRDGLLAAFARIGEKAAPALALCLRAAQPEDKLEGCALALSATHAAQAGQVIRDALERGSVGPEVALLSLARAGDPETLAIALSYLGHADAAVRRAALLAGSALLDPRRADGRAVEPLETAFERGQKRRSERLELIRLLGRTGSPRAARLLTPIAERADDLEFRVAALSALAELGPDAAPQTLLKGLSDPEAPVRFAAALAIRRSAPRGLAVTVLDRLERGSAQDRRALGLALPGVFSGSPSEAVLARALAMLGSSRAGERDALIEAIGHLKLASAGPALATLVKSADPADRAKVAEMLAFRADSGAALVALAADADSTVRANAIWALGRVASGREAPVLLRALRDADAATAANAAAALGRVGLREKVAVDRDLCALLDDRRGPVRAGALSALRLVAKRCGDGRERRLLSSDRSARARLAAALLIRDVERSEQDVRALERCTSEEPIGAVGAACQASRGETPHEAGEVLVFVVPAGEAVPVSGAPFALVRPDGLTRHGASDRRGAVCELGVPDGEVELSTHAALDE